VTIQTVPLSVTPNQAFSLVLNERNVNITLRTLQDQLYIDVVCAGVTVCAGQVCRDRVELTGRARYLGFPDLSLVFADLRGTDDPSWLEFGTRYVLLSVGDPAAVNPMATASTPVSALTFDGSEMYNGSQFYDGSLN
jgi:hypothetical protein